MIRTPQISPLAGMTPLGAKPKESKLDMIKRMAQLDANRTGKPMAVLNLNRHNPLYVVRLLTPAMEVQPDFVCRVDPTR